MENLEALEVSKLPITPTLRNLEVGDECEFPIEQRSSVQAIILRLKTERMRIGWDAEMTTDTKAFKVSVKRLK